MTARTPLLAAPRHWPALLVLLAALLLALTQPAVQAAGTSPEMADLAAGPLAELVVDAEERDAGCRPKARRQAQRRTISPGAAEPDQPGVPPALSSVPANRARPVPSRAGRAPSTPLFLQNRNLRA